MQDNNLNPDNSGFDPKGAALVKEIVGEIAAMEYAGDIRAIAAVMIDKDGDVRTLTAFQQGTKLPIIAGVSLLQKHVPDVAPALPKPKDRD